LAYLVVNDEAQGHTKDFSLGGGVSQNKVNKLTARKACTMFWGLKTLFWEPKCLFCLIFPGFDPTYPPFYFPRKSSFIIF
jgi:hypothetical protein